MLTHLEIKNFRNLSDLFIEPSSQFNVFVGDNGSGKTSLLEAVHYLGVGRSFRTHLASRVIQHEAQGFTLFAKLIDVSDKETAVGIGKSRGGDTQLRVNHETIRSMAELASLCPVLLINHDSYQLLDGGPKCRRQYIDWLLFHVEQSFYSVWQKSQRILKQRNAALRQQLPDPQVKIWDSELVEVNIALNALRRQYLELLFPLIERNLSQLLEVERLEMSFYPGWREDQDYQCVLNEALQRDRQLGYTQYGAHRADIVMRINKLPVADVLSRGQQKLFACAMLLSQGLLLQEEANKRCIYLLDDLPAELDSNKQRQIASLLQKLQAQVFITGVEVGELAPIIELGDSKLFHVKHGVVEVST